MSFFNTARRFHMKCYTDCVYNQVNECTRDTTHLIQAKCKDGTVFRCDTKKFSKDKESEKQQVYIAKNL